MTRKGKKGKWARTDSGLQDAEPGQRRILPAGGLGGVAHQPFEHGEIVEEAAAAGLGEAAGGGRTVALEALGDLDETGLLQHLQMPGEIAVGQAAELLEIGEGQPLRMAHQRGQKAEPRFLMDHAVEAVIGKRRAVLSLRHRRLRMRNKGSPPSAPARPRTAGPWSKAKERGWCWRAAAQHSQPGNTRRRPAPPVAAAIARRRRRRARAGSAKVR